MIPAPPLAQQAEEFAERMTRMVRSAVTEDVEIRAVRLELPIDTFLVGNRIPEAPSPTEEAIRTLRGVRIPTGVPSVELEANWRFVPSSSGDWLKTDWSLFALVVGDAPFIRLEVDPSKGGHDVWLAAHIQIIGESHLLGYVLGLQSKRKRRLQNLHLPVGGFRFRPGLEDFLEFAIDEELIPGKDGWEEALDETRVEFRRKQFMAMVADHPDWAREGLAYVDARKTSEEE